MSYIYQSYLRDVKLLKSARRNRVVIALSLPENDKHRIREKVFREITLDDLKKKLELEKYLRS